MMMVVMNVVMVMVGGCDGHGGHGMVVVVNVVGECWGVVVVYLEVLGWQWVVVWWWCGGGVVAVWLLGGVVLVVMVVNVVVLVVALWCGGLVMW